MAATTQQILDHHLKCFGEADLEGILEDYADSSLLFTQNGILRGPDDLRPLFRAFFADFAKPGLTFEMKQQNVEGETAYIVWSAETAANVYELGTDTFFIRDGKIVSQSFTAKVVPKS